MKNSYITPHPASQSSVFKSFGIIALHFLFIQSAYAQMSITSPLGSTIWHVGNTYEITWTHTPPVPATVNLIMTFDNGSMAITSAIASGISSSPGTYSYQVPNSMDYGPYYTLCLEDPADPENYFGCTPVFTIAEANTGLVDQHKAVGGLTIFPQPVKDESTIRFMLKEKSPLKITLFNILGNEVACLKNELTEAGPLEMRFPTSLKPGVYFVQIETSGSMLNRKVVVE